jgi:hypothetical protein
MAVFVRKRPIFFAFVSYAEFTGSLLESPPRGLEANTAAQETIQCRQTVELAI